MVNLLIKRLSSVYYHIITQSDENMVFNDMYISSQPQFNLIIILFVIMLNVTGIYTISSQDAHRATDGSFYFDII